MEPEQVELLAWYEACHRWASTRGVSFVRWQFDELVHEAFLIAIEQRTAYDRTKGSIDTFLRSRLFEPVRRAYAKQHNQRIERKRINGVYGTRTFVRWCHNCEPFPDVIEQQPSEPIELEAPCGALFNVFQLLARGLTQAQAARALGVSDAAVHQVVQRLRAYFTNAALPGISDDLLPFLRTHGRGVLDRNQQR